MTYYVIEKKENFMISMVKKEQNKEEVEVKTFSHKCSVEECKNNQDQKKENQYNMPLKSHWKKYTLEKHQK